MLQQLSAIFFAYNSNNWMKGSYHVIISLFQYNNFAKKAKRYEQKYLLARIIKLIIKIHRLTKSGEYD